MQDSTNARFDTCFFPYLSIIPTVIVAFISLSLILRRFHQLRPRWTQPFIKEFNEPKGELSDDNQRAPFNLPLISLLFSTFVGLVGWLIIIVKWNHYFSSILSAISWVSSRLDASLFCSGFSQYMSFDSSCYWCSRETANLEIQRVSFCCWLQSLFPKRLRPLS